MASPIQQFIENYMRMSQMNEQQRQFDEAQVLQRRQIENAEINQFVTIAQNAKNEAEIGQLASFFAERNPALAAPLQELSLNLVQSLAAQKSEMIGEGLAGMDPARRGQVAQGAAVGAMTGQDVGSFAESNAVAALPEIDLTRAARVGRNLEMGATDLESAEQFDQNLAQSMNQFLMSHAQNESQFNRQLGQRSHEFGISTDLQRAQLAQQGTQGEMQIMAGAGLLPSMLRGQLSQEAANLENQLRHSIHAPESRAAAERRLRELNASISNYDKLIAGEGEGGMNMNQMYQAAGTAWEDVNKSKDMGEKSAAIERYNRIARQLGLQELRPVNPWFGGPKSEILNGGQR